MWEVNPLLRLFIKKFPIYSDKKEQDYETCNIHLHIPEAPRR